VADRPTGTADVAMVRPLIDETTALVLKVDTAQLVLPDLPDVWKPASPESEEAYHRWLRPAAERIKTLRTATGGQTLYAAIGIPISKTDRPVFFFLKSAPSVDQKLLVEQLGLTVEGLKSFTREGVIVATPVGRRDLAAALDAIHPSPRREIGDAFESIAKFPIQVLLLPPDYVRRTVVELMPQLPRQLGGGPSDVLTQGLIWAAFGLDPGQLRAELVIQSASETAARRLAEHFPKMLRGVYDALPDLHSRLAPEAFGDLLSLLTPKAEGNRVVLRLENREVTGGSLRLMATIAAKLQEQMRRETNKNHFKTIMIALHNYHDAYKMFPPRDELRDKQGKTGLSWRVHVLPFIDEQKLYEEFHLDEPWDSPHNKTLIERMPKVYQGQWFGVAPGHTTFLSPVGEDTVLGDTKATKLSDITDGLSNTVVLVDVEPALAVPWTAPKDYAFDPKSPAQGLHIKGDGLFLAGFADGAVQRIRGEKVKPKLLLQLFRKSDGNSLDWNGIR